MHYVLIIKKFNQRGFSLVEVLIATALLSVAGLGLTLTVVNSLKIKANQQANAAVSLFREKIIATVNSTNGWIETISKNNISCLAVGTTGCSGVGFGQFKLFDGSGVQLTGLTQDNFGFNKDLTYCDYNLSTCPFRFVIGWSPICNDPTCLVPLIKFSGILEVKPDFTKVLADGMKYDFSFVRGVDFGNAKNQCDSVGGTFDPGTSTCDLNSVAGDCPVGQIVIGLQPNGQIECGPLLNDSCPVGTYGKGIRTDGKLICERFTTLTCPPYPPGGTNTASPGGGGADGGGGDGGGGDCGDGGGDCGDGA
ncbi:MAG: type II secretion system protein [Bdellovibrionaceae bacterium]|nr:type II secretion system protein [Pseudobdellovibrionaceae bacterium]